MGISLVRNGVWEFGLEAGWGNGLGLQELYTHFGSRME
jgi:hypothetical protein